MLSTNFRLFKLATTNATLWARFNKQWDLTIPKTAQMVMNISADDLLTMCKLKNKCVTSYLHIDQRNISTAQISVVAKYAVRVIYYGQAV